MKRIIISIISILICIAFTHAQQVDTINQTDESGLKQGHWEKRYPNGNIQYKGNFKDNKPVGLIKRYNQEGTLIAEMDYIESSKKVYTKLYYKSEKLPSKFTMIL